MADSEFGFRRMWYLLYKKKSQVIRVSTRLVYIFFYKLLFYWESYCTLPELKKFKFPPLCRQEAQSYVIIFGLDGMAAGWWNLYSATNCISLYGILCRETFMHCCFSTIKLLHAFSYFIKEHEAWWRGKGWLGTTTKMIVVSLYRKLYNKRGVVITSL